MTVTALLRHIVAGCLLGKAGPKYKTPCGDGPNIYLFEQTWNLLQESYQQRLCKIISMLVEWPLITSTFSANLTTFE